MADQPLVHSDAILSYADAERWVQELYQVSPASLEARLAELEPALVAVAMDLASRLQHRLAKAGVDEVVAAEVAVFTTRTGVICAELTRRAFRKFYDESDQGGAA